MSVGAVRTAALEPWLAIERNISAEAQRIRGGRRNLSYIHQIRIRNSGVMHPAMDLDKGWKPTFKKAALGDD